MRIVVDRIVDNENHKNEKRVLRSLLLLAAAAGESVVCVCATGPSMIRFNIFPIDRKRNVQKMKCSSNSTRLLM